MTQGHGQREESCIRYVITSSPTPLVRTCEHQYGGTYSNFVFLKEKRGNNYDHITSEPLIVEISMTTHFLAKNMNLTNKG